jgi:tRNA A37 N6-isopentenylltransferase MiaA
VLEKSIVKRLEEMLGGDGGAWLSEIVRLRRSKWEEFAKKKGFIGYAELFAWAERGSPLHELAEIKRAIFIKTRQYIKKQLCFWRGLKRQIVEADKKKAVEIVELSAIEELEEQVLGEKWDLVGRRSFADGRNAGR